MSASNMNDSDNIISNAIDNITSVCTTLKQLLTQGTDVNSTPMTKAISKARNSMKKKPDGHPKAPRTAYNFYCASRRAALKMEGHAPNSILKICGTEWSNLGPTQWATFKELNEEDKERYAREKATFYHVNTVDV